MNLEQKELLISLTERWINEINDNIANLEINMPKDLQGMVQRELEKALILAGETLEMIYES